jgi:2-methylcitrate dehydratase PrpD
MNVHTLSKSTAADTDGLSRRLCEAVVDWRFEDLPADVVDIVKYLMVDTFGVIGGAARAPGIAELNRRLSRWEPSGSATGLIGRRRYSPPSAALANGAAAHALDFDDMHDPARIHSFCVVLPTLMAAAEDIGDVDGRRFVAALALAAEVHTRLGFTANNCLGKGWHPTTVLGALAAAMGVAKLLNLDADGMLNAMGIAFHQAQGTAQSMHDGVLTKRLGAGLAARNAVTAGFLAADGITGPFRPLEGAAGLFQLFERGEVNAARLLDGIGDSWEMRGFAFKPYPCCRCNHTSIGLAFDLRERGIRAADVKSVEILLPQVNFQTVGQPYDVTRDSVVHAQFNIAYAFARALTDGHVDLKTYTKPNISDPTIVSLAERVTARPDPDESPTAMEPAKIRVELTDGNVVSVEGRRIKGAPDMPMSEDEILAKFRGCFEFGLEVPADAADRYAQQILDVESCADVAELARAFPASSNHQGEPVGDLRD